MIKLTHKDLTLWISKEEICYISREKSKVPTTIIQINEKEDFTVVALKSGRNLMVDQTPEEIISQMEKNNGS